MRKDKKRYVSYFGCKFEVVKELNAQEVLLRNCAVKLKKEDIKAAKQHLNTWIEEPTYGRF